MTIELYDNNNEKKLNGFSTKEGLFALATAMLLLGKFKDPKIEIDQEDHSINSIWKTINNGKFANNLTEDIGLGEDYLSKNDTKWLHENLKLFMTTNKTFKLNKLNTKDPKDIILLEEKIINEILSLTNSRYIKGKNMEKIQETYFELHEKYKDTGLIEVVKKHTLPLMEMAQYITLQRWNKPKEFFSNSEEFIEESKEQEEINFSQNNKNLKVSQTDKIRDKLAKNNGKLNLLLWWNPNYNSMKRSRFKETVNSLYDLDVKYILESLINDKIITKTQAKLILTDDNIKNAIKEIQKNNIELNNAFKKEDQRRLKEEKFNNQDLDENFQPTDQQARSLIIESFIKKKTNFPVLPGCAVSGLEDMIKQYQKNRTINLTFVDNENENSFSYDFRECKVSYPYSNSTKETFICPILDNNRSHYMTLIVGSNKNNVKYRMIDPTGKTVDSETPEKIRKIIKKLYPRHNIIEDVEVQRDRTEQQKLIQDNKQKNNNCFFHMVDNINELSNTGKCTIRENVNGYKLRTKYCSNEKQVPEIKNELIFCPLKNHPKRNNERLSITSSTTQFAPQDVESQ